MCHLAIVVAIAGGYLCAELWRRRRALCTRAALAASSGEEEEAPCHVVMYETGVKTYLVACWYFWLPCALGFQMVLLVIDAVHMWGDRPFEDAMSAPCDARNNAFLFVPLLGENWHNNHHSTPRSASLHIWWYQLDCQYMVIRLFELLGLATDVSVVPPPSALRAGYSTDGLVPWVFCQYALSLLLCAAIWWAPALRTGGPRRADGGGKEQTTSLLQSQLLQSRERKAMRSWYGGRVVWKTVS